MGSGSTKKYDVLSTNKDVNVPPKKERSIYYYPNYDSFQKGDNFEAVIRGYFPETFFDLTNSSSIADVPVGKADEQATEPKFRFRHKHTGVCFWVASIFVDKSPDGNVHWADKDQFIRFEQFQENHKPESVYLVLGFGGTPHRPKSIYCISLENIDSPDLHPSSIERYRHRLDQVFRCENGSVV